MLCECSDESCPRVFPIDLGVYREIRADGFLTVPGHSVDGHEPTSRTAEYWQHGAEASSVHAPHG